MLGIPYRIRTGVAAVKGQCPRPLDERDVAVRVIIENRHPIKRGGKVSYDADRMGRIGCGVQRGCGFSRLMAAARRPVRQAPEQKRTLSQSRAHFFRQVNGRPHAAQSLVGRSDFAVMAGPQFRPRRRCAGR